MRSPTLRTASVVPQKSKAGKSGTAKSGTTTVPVVADAAVPLSRYGLFFSLAIVGCLLDLATKHVMFAWKGLPPPWRQDPSPHTPWWLWENVIGIETALNQGALFGIGQGKVWLFASLSFVAAGGITYWLFGAKAARDRLLTIALGLIMGGILGNLWDRLGLWANPDGETIYAVRDWILIAYGGADLPLIGTRWPNFNIADSLLVCGAGILIWHSFRAPKTAQEKSEPSDKKKN